jgi:hypothetical protein
MNTQIYFCNFVESGKYSNLTKIIFSFDLTFEYLTECINGWLFKRFMTTLFHGYTMIDNGDNFDEMICLKGINRNCC